MSEREKGGELVSSNGRAVQADICPSKMGTLQPVCCVLWLATF
jgi:hypothetical protein